MQHMSKAQIEKNISKTIAEVTASMNAFKAVKINTKHKKLTNKAIENGTIRDYLSINKCLVVSYSVDYADGSKRYMSDELPAYSYHDENGQEIGTNGFVRISRTITPTELAKLVNDLIQSKKEYIELLQNEYTQAEELANERQAIEKQIEEFNKKVSHASDARLVVR